jgi:hypothetical protein
MVEWIPIYILICYTFCWLHKFGEAFGVFIKSSPINIIFDHLTDYIFISIFPRRKSLGMALCYLRTKGAAGKREFKDLGAIEMKIYVFMFHEL